nr:IQ domain-containing protein K isoform X5 [Taeniopygia guttata]
MNVKLIQNCSQSSILIAEPLRFSQSLRTLRLHRWETSTALLQRGYLPSALTSAQSRRFAFKCPFSALQGVLEHEAEQPQVSDVPQSKQDPESKQESVSAVQVPLEAAIPMEQLFSAPAAQYLLPILGEAPPGEPPDPKKCSPREYLEFYIFPVVLPGLAALLHETEKEKCFEGKRTTFIPSDFLTEWLYNNNPKRKDESFTELFSIPFVKDWLKDQFVVTVKYKSYVSGKRS